MKAIVQNQPIKSEAGVTYTDGVYEFDERWTRKDAKDWLKANGIRWIRFDEKNSKMEKETRVLNTEFRVETRDEKPVVRGYAAVFNSLSENLGGFREQIEPGAFDDVLKDDTRALYNHDLNMVLGRTRSKTLTIGVDDKGLWYEYIDPDTSYSRDLLQTMKRGDVDQSSFAFRVAPSGDNWGEDSDGNMIRTVTKLSRLYDVSPVTYPAYPDTSVAKRSMDLLDQQKAEQEKSKEDLQKEINERENILRELELK